MNPTQSSTRFSRRVTSLAMEGNQTGVNQGVKEKGRVTITEAATLLGVHPNTVRGRVKAGTYEAEKVATEHGLTWMIDPDSLVNATLPKDSQQPPSQMVNPDAVTPMEMVQDLLRPFVEDLGRVREELGAERVRREQAERERDELLARLEALQAPEAAAGRSEGASPRPAMPGPQTGAGEPEEPPDATETRTEAVGEADTPETRAESHASVQEPEGAEETARRPWWLRWLGG